MLTTSSSHPSEEQDTNSAQKEELEESSIVVLALGSGSGGSSRGADVGLSFSARLSLAVLVGVGELQTVFQSAASLEDVFVLGGVVAFAGDLDRVKRHVRI